MAFEDRFRSFGVLRSDSEVPERRWAVRSRPQRLARNAITGALTADPPAPLSQAVVVPGVQLVRLVQDLAYPVPIARPEPVQVRFLRPRGLGDELQHLRADVGRRHRAA